MTMLEAVIFSVFLACVGSLAVLGLLFLFGGRSG